MRERIYGLDLLRILSMFFIPVLHIIGQGGLMNAFSSNTGQYQVIWLLETGALCATNCFALTSGYVGVNSRWRWSSMLRLHLTVSFYTLLITAIFALRSPALVDWERWRSALFPVVYGQYWYFTAYFGLFFLMPFLNRMLLALKKKELTVFVWVLAALFSLLPTLTHQDLFRTTGGYSFVWLLLLYLLGGGLRRLSDLGGLSLRRPLLLYPAGWLATFVLYRLLRTFALYDYASAVIKYYSPTVLLCSVGLLLGCAALPVGRAGARALAFFSPCAFSVYLIHTQPLIWENLMLNRFAGFQTLPPWGLAVAILACAGGIWLSCSLADRVRLLLFRLLPVDRLCRRADEALPELSEGPRRSNNKSQ